MKQKTLSEIRQVLHGLLKNLPAIKNHCSQEVVKRHMALIAYYQRQYDQLAASVSPSAMPI